MVKEFIVCLLEGIPCYLKEIIKLSRVRPQCVSALDLIRYFPDWWSSIISGRNPLVDKRPWISFAAIRFLEDILKKDMRVYEYGTGGSTLFFSRYVKEVIATEHDQSWYNTVMGEINKNNIHNCQLRLFEPNLGTATFNRDISDPDAYISDCEVYRGMSFKNYASSIDAYPDEFFDVIFIDGRSRPSCFKHAVKKVKTGGYLVLDNAETPYYSYIHMALSDKKWKRYDFYGPFPYIHHFSETCVWYKLNT